MDIFGNRATLLMNYPEIVVKMHKKRRQENEGQTSLFNENENVKMESKISQCDLLK